VVTLLASFRNPEFWPFFLRRDSARPVSSLKKRWPEIKVKKFFYDTPILVLPTVKLCKKVLIMNRFGTRFFEPFSRFFGAPGRFFCATLLVTTFGTNP
jgi:hypothetical protein